MATAKTIKPTKSTSSTVRLRTRVTTGPGLRAAGLAMARKLIRSARQRWRAANEPHLIAVARAGTPVDNGRLARRAEPGAAA